VLFRLIEEISLHRTMSLNISQFRQLSDWDRNSQLHHNGIFASGDGFIGNNS